MKRLLHISKITFLALLLFALSANVFGQTNYTITIHQPNEANLEWVLGQSYLISWSNPTLFTKPAKIEVIKVGEPNNGQVILITPPAGVMGTTFIWNTGLTYTPALTVGSYLVRVTNTVNSSYVGTSTIPVKIVNSLSTASIKVEQPNLPGINWVKGTTNLISWVDNIPGTVNIQLANYGVTPNTFTNLATNVEGSTFLWTIPSSVPVGSQFKIKIFSTDDIGIVDWSDNNFSISEVPIEASIEVLQPSETGITWLPGSTYLISWLYNAPGRKVNIMLNKGDGSPIHPIAYNVQGSTYAWTIPNGIPTGSTYRVEVWDEDFNLNIVGVSENTFAIQNTLPGGGITIQQPNAGGITWLKGSTYLISWIDNIIEPVGIQLVNYGVTPNTFTTIASNISGTTHSFTVPQSTPNGSNYKIKIYSMVNPSTVFDHSDAPFSIADVPPGSVIEVLQPSVNGITWLRGSTYLISWIGNYQTGPINITLNNHETNVITPIAYGVEGSTYVWTIPADINLGSLYKVEVWNDNFTLAGESQYHFSIQNTLGGTIEILQPNGGETLFKGTAYLISWIDNVDEPVNIQLANYGTSPHSFTNLASNVTGSTWIWNISNTIPDGNQFKIKIFSSLSTSIVDWSDGYFTITDLPLTYSVYPNPASDYFTVLFDEEANETFTVQLFNRLNLPMLTRTVNAQSLKEYRISTADLPNGVYFLNISSDKTKNTQKIIVQH
jgi:hypothetical protein